MPIIFACDRILLCHPPTKTHSDIQAIYVSVMHRSGVRLSVRPSVCLSNLFSKILTLIGRAAHTQRDSPGGSTRREYYDDGHTCLKSYVSGMPQSYVLKTSTAV